MGDGFHWMRVTSKQLRFLYEEVTTLPPPPRMRELAAAIDRDLDAVAHSQQVGGSENGRGATGLRALAAARRLVTPAAPALVLPIISNICGAHRLRGGRHRE